MKKQRNILVLFLTLGLFACNNISDKATKKGPQYDCNSLNDKKVIYKIAKSIIEKHDNDQIWNLSEVDTSDFFTTEDFFTNIKSKNILVFIRGTAGMSSGTADNLLILLSCTDTFNIVWAGQVGDIKQSDIKDMNGDGIKDIICNSNMMWQGECNDHYEIFNFKEGKQNSVYSAHSISFIDCGFDNISDIYKRGDTLEHNFECSLLQSNNKMYFVQQIQTTKIHNGGKTNKEILKKIKVIMDTTIVKLK